MDEVWVGKKDEQIINIVEVNRALFSKVEVLEDKENKNAYRIGMIEMREEHQKIEQLRIEKSIEALRAEVHELKKAVDQGSGAIGVGKYAIALLLSTIGLLLGAVNLALRLR